MPEQSEQIASPQTADDSLLQKEKENIPSIFPDYDFDLKRDRRFSSIIFSHLSRINNYPKNKDVLNRMYDSSHESIRKIAAFMDYPPIPDGQIESLRMEIQRGRSDSEHAKPPLWASLVSNIITGYLNKSSGKVLEIGTFTGFTSAYLAKRNPNSHVTTLDISERLVDIANKNYEALGLHNVKAFHSDYRTFPLNEYDVIFKDGLHKGQANIDLADYLSKLNKPTLLVLDDIRWSWDMYKAWMILNKREYVKASIDCYHIGALLISPDESGSKEKYKYSLPGLIPR